MSDPRFLLIRLGSMGDIIHALPAASALRDTFPGARIDWAVEQKWKRLLEGNYDISEVISVDRKSAGGIFATFRKLRAARYDCAIDFQALYKSAILAYGSRAPKRIGFQSSYAREGIAAKFYTDRFNPRGPHKVDHNLALARHAGAGNFPARFPLAVRAEDEQIVSRELAAHDLHEFFVLNPGGGWRSKCWPTQRYGELHRRLLGQYRCRGVVTYGPGEENLAKELIAAAGENAPVAILLGLGPLMALMRRAKFVVSADTGPLHLASALGAPVIGLYGPTDPARNGPFSADDVSVRNPQFSNTTYRRGEHFDPAMLSITVEQVLEAVAERLRRLASAS
jgi:lipopolysaccharide heptosyltransferase I